jgi:hypothetical protein
VSKERLQCTPCIHVDDIQSRSSMGMTAELTDGLKNRYGEVTLKHGPLINSSGIIKYFAHPAEVGRICQ